MQDRERRRSTVTYTAWVTGSPRADVARTTGCDTTFIISLAIATKPFHLLVIEIAVGILTLQAIAINRLADTDCPLWALRNRPVITEPVAGGS